MTNIIVAIAIVISTNTYHPRTIRHPLSVPVGANGCVDAVYRCEMVEDPDKQQIDIYSNTVMRFEFNGKKFENEVKKEQVSAERFNKKIETYTIETNGLKSTTTKEYWVKDTTFNWKPGYTVLDMGFGGTIILGNSTDSHCTNGLATCSNNVCPIEMCVTNPLYNFWKDGRHSTLEDKIQK